MSDGEEVHAYHAYGLTVASQVELPELLPASRNGPADITIRLGDVPEALEAPNDSPFGRGVLYQATDESFLLSINEVARYLVSRGEEIVVAPAEGALPEDIRIFMLGSCFGALLHQRGILALHASAIRHGDHAIAFAGHSGAGKSTLLSALLKRGHPMLADDITGIQVGEDGRPIVLPAFPRTKLWADAAAKLEHDTSNLRPTRPGLQKYELPVRDQFVTEALPLTRLYILRTANEDKLELEPLEPLQSFAVLAEHTYRPRYLDAIQSRGAHLRLGTQVAQHVAVRQVQRPSHPYRLQELVELLEADFTSPLKGA